jgi:ubiquinone/menaquinone biosynthesis C-methylase UbiE
MSTPLIHQQHYPSAARACCSDAWEGAYLSLGGDAQETAKFRRRLKWLGCHVWPRDARIAEICCGSGDGLDALSEFGFSNVVGIDLSHGLLSRYSGSVPVLLGDCRCLPLRSASCDVVIVQGGLHHLDELDEELEATFAEVRRVLRPMGKFVVVEPWRTRFLDLFHFASRLAFLRKVWPRFDAMATMTELEHEGYWHWLSSASLVRDLLESAFVAEYARIGWGKLWYVGRPR